MFQLNKPPSQPIEHSSTPLSRPLCISLRKHLYSKFHAPASAARLEFTILKILIKQYELAGQWLPIFSIGKVKKIKCYNDHFNFCPKDRFL